MQKLIDYLRGCPEGFNPTCGLCSNVAEITDCDAYKAFDDTMDKVIRGWQHYSGRAAYPVSGGKPAYLAARCTNTLYTGEYGRRRIELANLIADELEKQLCKS
jgi:hypothetical protein